MTTSASVRRRCLFCGAERKLDTQHVWSQAYSQWLLNAGVLEAGTEFVGEHYSGATGKRRPAGRGSQINLVVRRQCQKCNSGWMNQLEQAARRVMEPDILFAQPRHLSWLDQLDIASWATLMAMTFEFSHGRRARPFFTPDERQWISETGTPPGRTLVWIARHNSTNHVAWGADWDLSWPIPPGAPRHGTRTSINGYCLTFTAGLTVLQVLSHHWLPNGVGIALPIIEVESPQSWGNVTQQIWPVVQDVAYPPMQIFDDAGLTKFANRWSSSGPPTPPT